MKSKYELPFSIGYVPDWTYIEAFRELFQNALDNEAVTPANEMLFEYDPDSKILRVGNRTSALSLDSLLLGSTTKAKDERTIGQHGEGYKIAFLVLLREGRTVTVYNYGKREVWTTRLVKSKRYNGQTVPVVTVDREATWKRVPDHDLTIEVGNVTPEEYQAIVKKNLNLQAGVLAYEIPSFGRILLDEQERGNVYVKGLFVCHSKAFRYGYDMDPRLINLDRDRRMVSSFDLAWETSAMWKTAFAQQKLRSEMLSMIIDGAQDVQYIQNRSAVEENVELELADSLATRFVRMHGAAATPVINNNQLRAAGSSAVLVNAVVCSYLEQATRIQVHTLPPTRSLEDKLDELSTAIHDRLNDSERALLLDIINQVHEMERPF